MTDALQTKGRSLDGAVVLITGASSGIGEATARLASARGAKLVLAARRRERLEVLAAELGGEVEFVQADLRDLAQMRHVVARALECYGRVDVLVNNAAQGLHVPLAEVTDEDFRAIFELNVLSPLVAMREVLPAMREQGGGTIVNVSSGTARGAFPDVGPYAATKVALDKLGAVARVENGQYGIEVISIWPFLTATDFHKSFRAGELHVPAGIELHTPEYVAEKLLDAVEQGQEEVVLTPF